MFNYMHEQYLSNILCNLSSSMINHYTENVSISFQDE